MKLQAICQTNAHLMQILCEYQVWKWITVRRKYR